MPPPAFVKSNNNIEEWPACRWERGRKKTQEGLHQKGALARIKSVFSGSTICAAHLFDKILALRVPGKVNLGRDTHMYTHTHSDRASQLMSCYGCDPKQTVDLFLWDV